MKGQRKILWVSWTGKKTNEWVLNKAGVKRELLDTDKARRLAYYGHTMRKQGSCLEKEIMQGTMSDAHGRGRPRTAWMDNIKTWTGLPVEESIRMTEERDKWRKHVHGVANPRTRTAKEQNRTSALGQDGRDVCWPRRCCLLVSHSEYICYPAGQTDGRTDRRTDNRLIPLCAMHATDRKASYCFLIACSSTTAFWVLAQSCRRDN